MGIESGIYRRLYREDSWQRVLIILKYRYENYIKWKWEHRLHCSKRECFILSDIYSVLISVYSNIIMHTGGWNGLQDY